MPQSKYRRKPGGKAVKHPGRSKPPRVSFDAQGEDSLWEQFYATYTEPYRKRFPDDPLDAGHMLGLIADAAFVPADGGRLLPASKDQVFREFMQPMTRDPRTAEDDDLPPIPDPLQAAEAALAYLVEQGLVAVTDDEITVPAHFWSGTAADAT